MPAHIGFGLGDRSALPDREGVKGASGSGSESGPVEEDTGAIDLPGGPRPFLTVSDILGRFEICPAAFGACFGVLPGGWGEAAYGLGHALLIALIGEMGAQCATAVIGAGGIDARAALTENALPARGQPGEITTKDLILDVRVGELNERTRKRQQDLRHAHQYRADEWWEYIRRVRLGVLDIGSNTVHLLVVDARVGGAPNPAASHKRELRLAEHLQDDGTMSRRGIDSLISMVDSSRVFAEDSGCSRVLPFVTSAIREAVNCDDVINECREATGVELRVLSGFDEARATFLAARRWFGWSAGALSVFDIGGGSLEIATGRDEEPEVALSIPVGAGRMARRFGPTEVAEIRRYARAEIGSVIGDVLRRGPYDRAVATSKTFRTLGRITGCAPAADGDYVRRVLHRDKLAIAVEGIAEMPVEARSQLAGVSAGRSAQLLAGAVVAEAVMDLAGLTELEICPWALREGIILNYLDHLDYFPEAHLKARKIGSRMKLVEPDAEDLT